MPTTEFAARHRKILEGVLEAKRNLRREMVLLYNGLGEAWRNFPPEMPDEDKLSIMRIGMEKAVQELVSMSERLDGHVFRLETKYEENVVERMRHDVGRLTREMADLTRRHDELDRRLSEIRDGLPGVMKDIAAFQEDRGILSMNLKWDSLDAVLKILTYWQELLSAGDAGTEDASRPPHDGGEMA